MKDDINKIISLVVFGSYSRFENNNLSDLDLLGIVDKKNEKSLSLRDINLNIYTYDKLSELMINGELFALHLKIEGKAIFGVSIFKELTDKFKYKDSYVEQILHALFMWNMIVDNQFLIKNWDIANKRISWTIRTSIIAMSAEKRKPIFSKKAISNYLIIPNLDSNDVLSLINIKHQKTKNETLFKKAGIFFDYVRKENFLDEKINIDKRFINSTLDKLFNIDVEY